MPDHPALPFVMEARSRDAANHGWFAVQVRTGREHFSAEHLRWRGYEVFLPCYLQRRRWSDRVKEVNRALFAGYLFCRLHADAVGRIVTTPGVIRIVGSRNDPIPVPLQEIEAIQRMVETRLMIEPWPFLHAGQRVRVEAGPLRGTQGVVLRVKDRQRLIVSIPLLQRSVAVEIDPDWVSIPQAVLLADDQ